MHIGTHLEVFEVDGLSVNILLLLGTLSLPILLNKSLHLFVRIFKHLQVLIVKSLPHPHNVILPEVIDSPLLNVFHDVTPFMQILHRVKNGLVDVGMLAVGPGDQQFEQFLDGCFWVILNAT